MSIRLPVLMGLLACSLPCIPAAPVGIPRELALERASEISNLRYSLSFTLEPRANSAAGSEEIRFALSTVRPLLLDFRGDAAATLIVNGRALPIKAENGHIEIPPDALTTGENLVSLKFSAPIGAGGKVLTRYEDKQDGSEYIYTLFVPMDASMAFPCFDQPDLKGRFTLTLNYPTAWEVISNARQSLSESHGSISKLLFEETKPISTYLFAFAAGPFQRMRHAEGMPDVYVRKSQVARAQVEALQVQQTASDGIKFLSGYFAQKFPFPKYDMVLLPGFPYGGMEHAGATFLNEDSILFRSAPTEDDRFNRAILLLHELAHQWFGDFTTMRWFDDLWLKEGFAQYMAFRTMDAIFPKVNVWAHFYQQIKPAAYGIDVTKGTTPIYQDIRNLKDAKSAYGAIVYSKAPALLRQLAFMLGDEQFRDGLRLYLSAHAYANADWSDLIKAFERSSGQTLRPWADAWIRRRGAPRVDVHWTCDEAHRINHFTLTQKNVLDEGGEWPIATQVLLGYTKQAPERLRVNFATPRAEVPAAVGKACPEFAFGNDGDYAYGLFLLDPQSREYIQRHVGSNADLFQRTLFWGALWDALRFTELAPRDYLAATLRDIPSEEEELITQAVSTRSVAALHEYVSPEMRSDLGGRFEKLAVDRMLHASAKGQRIIWFRTLVSAASTPAGLDVLKDLLNAKLSIPDVELRPLDRWRMVTTLLAQGDADRNAFFEAERLRDSTGIGPKYAYVAAAAKADADDKKWYFEDYLHNAGRQEDWVQESLGNFNEWNQSALTKPYLQRALEALPNIKQERKIFFVVAWLDAFISGQQSRESDVQAHLWLESADLDPDLKLKVLQALDDLDRKVRIRARYP